VQACHDAAQEGDTITLPAGTFPWTSGVRVTKGITIRGQTATNSDTGVCDDQTILVDNIPGTTRFFNATELYPQAYRITGITFAGGTGNGGGNGILSVGGSTNPNIVAGTVRIDHNHVTGVNRAKGFELYSGIGTSNLAVVDRNVMDHLSAPQNCQNRVDNGSYPYGDVEWSQPAGYGGPNFLFVEDNYLNNDSGAHFSAGYGWDAIRGSKVVFRHNHLFNIEILCHGQEGDRNRGGRAQEIYDNDYHADYAHDLDGIRSGGLITHDNTFVGIVPSGYGLQAYRRIFGYGSIWKGANGTCAWDVNDPVLYAAGTTSSGSGANVLVDTTRNWTSGMWINYELSRPSDGATWLITGNTSNSLTLNQWGDPCCIQTWAAGQGYEIRYVLQVMDQPCSGQGDLISGPTPTPAWPHQQREPCYSWNNQGVNFSVRSPELLEGRDYFSNTPMPGYTPYTYPHPLVLP
jgi:hypothetical protein